MMGISNGLLLLGAMRTQTRDKDLCVGDLGKNWAEGQKESS